MIFLFSWILEFISVVKAVEKKIQDEKTKRIKRRTKDEALKESDSIAEAHEKTKNSENVVEAEKKSKKLKGQKILIDVLKFVAELFEVSIIGTLIFIGILIFFVALVVILIMFILYGFLTNTGLIPEGGIYTPNEDCIQGTQVMQSTGYDLSQMSQLMGTLTDGQKQAAQILSMYYDIVNRDLSTVVADPSAINSIKNSIGATEVIHFLSGFGAVENSGGITDIPTNGDDLFKYPSLQSGAKYVFMGLCYDNVFDGKYGYDVGARRTQVLVDTFVDEIKQNYAYVETPKYENNFMPYGVSTQIGLVSTNSLTARYDKINEQIEDIAKQYGITTNIEKLKAYIHLFSAAATYHSGGGKTLGSKDAREGLISLWCALWSTTSDNDADRGFHNVKVVYDSYNYTEPQMRKFIFGDRNFYVSWGTNKSGFFEINGKSVDTILWQWVWDNCSNPDYFEQTAVRWFNKYQGPNSNKTDSPVTDSSYGFAAYLIGRDIAASIGISAPIATGGNIDDCDCYEGGTSGGSLALGNRDFSNVVIGEPQGIYPDNVVQLLKQYKQYQPYYGKLDSIQNPDAILSGSVTHEQWRLDSKWKVPYQYQSNGDSWQSGLFRGDYVKSDACPLYAQSYIYSAMTGRAVNVQEIQAAEAIYNNNMKLPSGMGPGGNDMCRAAFCQMAKDAGFYVRYIYMKNGVYTTKAETEGAKVDAPVLYPDSSLSLKEQIDYVLDNNGIVMVTVKGNKHGKYPGTGSSFAYNQHYFPITERVGENEYKTHSATCQNLDIKTSTFEEIVGKNACWLFTGHQTNLMFAWNPNLTTSSGGSAGNTTPTASDAEGRAKQMWDFLIQNGFSEESAAGIIGNSALETGETFDPSIIQKSNQHGAGLFQWTYYYNRTERFAALDDFAKSKGKTWDDLITQMEFMLNGKEELDYCLEYFSEPKYGKKVTLTEFKNLKDVNEATEIFVKAFERAGGVALSERQGYANKYYNMFKGTVTATGVGGTSSGPVITSFENFIFIGDSFTVGLSSTLNSKNKGFEVYAAGGAYPTQFTKDADGNGTYDIFEKAITIGQGNAKKQVGPLPDGSGKNGIVFLLGVNNAPTSTGEVTAGHIDAIKNFLTALRDKYGLPIYVQKVFPVGSGYIYKSQYATITADIYNKAIGKINTEIEAFCASSDGLIFIDTTSGLVENGYLKYPDDESLHIKSGITIEGVDSFEYWYSNIEKAVLSSGSNSTSTNSSSVNCISTGSNSGVSSAGAIDLDLGVDDYTEKIKAGSWGHSYTKTRTKDEIKFIVVHFWGSQSKNSGDAQGLIHGYETGGMNREDGKTYMAQYVVDKDGIYRTAPDLVNVQHSGGGLDKTKGSGYVYNNALKPLGMERCTSNNSIGIEASNSDLNNTAATDNPNANVTKGFYVYEKGTIENLISLTKALMIEYNIDVDHIYRHYDCTMKTCPAPFIDDQYLWPSSASEYDKGESQNWKAFKECLTSDTIDWSKFNDHVVDNIK